MPTESFQCRSRVPAESPCPAVRANESLRAITRRSVIRRARIGRRGSTSVAGTTAARAIPPAYSRSSVLRRQHSDAAVLVQSRHVVVETGELEQERGTGRGRARAGGVVGPDEARDERIPVARVHHSIDLEVVQIRRTGGRVLRAGQDVVLDTPRLAGHDRSVSPVSRDSARRDREFGIQGQRDAAEVPASQRAEISDTGVAVPGAAQFDRLRSPDLHPGQGEGQ